MSGKYDDDDDDFNYSDGKYSGKYDEKDQKDEEFISANTSEKIIPPKVEVLDIHIEPAVRGPLSGPLELTIKFELDRDVIAGYWIVRLLVDSCDKRLIRVRIWIPVQKLVKSCPLFSNNIINLHI